MTNCNGCGREINNALTCDPLICFLKWYKLKCYFSSRQYFQYHGGWRNDPSYNWRQDVKLAKKGAKNGSTNR